MVLSSPIIHSSQYQQKLWERLLLALLHDTFGEGRVLPTLKNNIYIKCINHLYKIKIYIKYKKELTFLN